MSDFNDGPLLVAGSVYAYRSWLVDDQGRLHALHRPYMWTPGENVAADCWCGGTVTRPNRMAANRMTAQWGYVSHGHYVHTAPAESHRPAQPGCACGFWAYHAVPPHHPGCIVGVIEATGRIVVGDRGIRAEKARIVALLAPSRSHRPWHLRWWQEAAMYAVASVGLVGNALANVRGPLAGLMTVGGMAFGLLGILTARRGDLPRYEPPTIPMGLVRRNYLDVPVYRDPEAMCRDFPASPPEPAADPEAWSTRD